jgi:hypothetical protein
MTRPGPPARSIASARMPVPAASNTRVDRAEGADSAGEAGAVTHRRGPQLAGEGVVVLADRADHADALGDGELGGDDADRAAAADQQQRLAAGEVQLPEHAGGGLGRAGQRGGIEPRDRVGLAGPDRRHRVLGVTAQAEQQGRDAVARAGAGDAGPGRVDGAGGLEAEHGARGRGMSLRWPARSSRSVGLGAANGSHHLASGCCIGDLASRHPGNQPSGACIVRSGARMAGYRDARKRG